MTEQASEHDILTVEQAEQLPMGETSSALKLIAAQIEEADGDGRELASAVSDDAQLIHDAAVELAHLRTLCVDLVAAIKSAEEALREADHVAEMDRGRCRSMEKMESAKAWSDDIYAARAAIDRAREMGF